MSRVMLMWWQMNDRDELCVMLLKVLLGWMTHFSSTELFYNEGELNILKLNCSMIGMSLDFYPFLFIFISIVIYLFFLLIYLFISNEWVGEGHVCLEFVHSLITLFFGNCLSCFFFFFIIFFIMIMPLRLRRQKEKIYYWKMENRDIRRIVKSRVKVKIKVLKCNLQTIPKLIKRYTYIYIKNHTHYSSRISNLQYIPSVVIKVTFISLDPLRKEAG